MPLFVFVDVLNLRLGYLLPAAEAMAYLAVIAEVDKPLEAVEQTVVVVVEVMIVNDQCIKLVSRFKTSNLAKEPSGRFGGYPECFGQR